MTETSLPPSIVTMDMPVFERGRWWQFWRPRWTKIGTEKRAFSVVSGCEAPSSDGMAYLVDGGRSGFFHYDGPIRPEWFGALPEPLEPRK